MLCIFCLFLMKCELHKNVSYKLYKLDKITLFTNSFIFSLLSLFLFQTCMLCSPPMMLPNWCSVSAHQRIHKHRAPHVCPECGGTARQATFQTHLEESCLHFARRIGYRFLAFSFLSVFCKIAGSFQFQFPAKK